MKINKPRFSYKQDWLLSGLESMYSCLDKDSGYKQEGIANDDYTYLSAFIEDVFNTIKEDEICDHIMSFSNLEKGWNSYDAEGFEKSFLENACNFYNNLISVKDEIDVVPVADGSIQFEYFKQDHYRDYYLEVSYYPDSHIEYFYILPDKTGKIQEKEKTENVSLDEVNELIMKFFKVIPNKVLSDLLEKKHSNKK